MSVHTCAVIGHARQSTSAAARGQNALRPVHPVVARTYAGGWNATGSCSPAVSAEEQTVSSRPLPSAQSFTVHSAVWTAGRCDSAPASTLLPYLARVGACCARRRRQ